MPELLSVVTVKDGVVSALKEGKATVTVVSANGVFADQCEVTVKSDPTSIEEVNSGNRIYPTVTKGYLYADLQQARTIYVFIRMDSEVVKVIKRW